MFSKPRSPKDSKSCAGLGDSHQKHMYPDQHSRSLNQLFLDGLRSAGDAFRIASKAVTNIPAKVKRRKSRFGFCPPCTSVKVMTGAFTPPPGSPQEGRASRMSKTSSHSSTRCPTAEPLESYELIGQFTMHKPVLPPIARKKKSKENVQVEETEIHPCQNAVRLNRDLQEKADDQHNSVIRYYKREPQLQYMKIGQGEKTPTLAYDLVAPLKDLKQPPARLSTLDPVDVVAAKRHERAEIKRARRQLARQFRAEKDELKRKQDYESREKKAQCQKAAELEIRRQKDTRTELANLRQDRAEQFREVFNEVKIERAHSSMAKFEVSKAEHERSQSQMRMHLAEELEAKQLKAARNREERAASVMERAASSMALRSRATSRCSQVSLDSSRPLSVGLRPTSVVSLGTDGSD